MSDFFYVSIFWALRSGRF